MRRLVCSVLDWRNLDCNYRHARRAAGRCPNQHLGASSALACQNVDLVSSGQADEETRSVPTEAARIDPSGTQNDDEKEQLNAHFLFLSLFLLENQSVSQSELERLACNS